MNDSNKKGSQEWLPFFFCDCRIKIGNNGIRAGFLLSTDSTIQHLTLLSNTLMNTITKILGITAVLACTTPAMAQVSLDIHIGPPPPRREVIIAAPDPTYVWVGGYQRYDRDRNNYVWVPGAWQRPPRENVRWVQPRYVHNGDHYNYQEGKWADKHDNGKHKGQEKHEDKQGHGHGGGGDR